jgi:hypothetical protein
MSTGDAEQSLARLQSVIDGLEGDVRRADEELAQSQEARADHARSGRLGPDWQAVQGRIDQGRTTLADVFTGVDESPAATRLRETSRQNVTQLALEFEPPAQVQENLAEAEAQWEALLAETRPGAEE